MPPLRRAWIFALTSARDSGFVSNIRRRIESNFLSATALPLIDTEYQLSDMRDRDDHSPEYCRIAGDRKEGLALESTFT